MDKIRSKKNILSGFLIILLITTAIQLLLNKVPFVSGFLWGLTLSYCGLLLFIFLPNFKSDNNYQNLSVIQYLFRSIVRMSTLLIFFTVIVFVLKVNALALLAGSFIGMIGLSFIFLFKMKPSQ